MKNEKTIVFITIFFCLVFTTNALTYYDDFNSMSITETNITSYLCNINFFSGNPLSGTFYSYLTDTHNSNVRACGIDISTGTNIENIFVDKSVDTSDGSAYSLKAKTVMSTPIIDAGGVENFFYVPDFTSPMTLSNSSVISFDMKFTNTNTSYSHAITMSLCVLNCNSSNSYSFFIANNLVGGGDNYCDISGLIGSTTSTWSTKTFDLKSAYNYCADKDLRNLMGQSVANLSFHATYGNNIVNPRSGTLTINMDNFRLTVDGGECGQYPSNNCNVTASTTLVNGIYTLSDGININADLNCNGATIKGDGSISSHGIDLYPNSNNVHLSNCVIKDWTGNDGSGYSVGLGILGTSGINNFYSYNNTFTNNSIHVGFNYRINSNSSFWYNNFGYSPLSLGAQLCNDAGTEGTTASFMPGYPTSINFYHNYVNSTAGLICNAREPYTSTTNFFLNDIYSKTELTNAFQAASNNFYNNVSLSGSSLPLISYFYRNNIYSSTVRDTTNYLTQNTIFCYDDGGGLSGNSYLTGSRYIGNSVTNGTCLANITYVPSWSETFSEMNFSSYVLTNQSVSNETHPYFNHSALNGAEIQLFMCGVRQSCGTTSKPAILKRLTNNIDSSNMLRVQVNSSIPGEYTVPEMTINAYGKWTFTENSSLSFDCAYGTDAPGAFQLYSWNDNPIGSGRFKIDINSLNSGMPANCTMINLAGRACNRFDLSSPSSTLANLTHINIPFSRLQQYCNANSTIYYPYVIFGMNTDNASTYYDLDNLKLNNMVADLTCNDNFCNWWSGEDATLCAQDCGFCGDNVCSAVIGENSNTCLVDCPVQGGGGGGAPPEETPVIYIPPEEIYIEPVPEDFEDDSYKNYTESFSFDKLSWPIIEAAGYNFLSDHKIRNVLNKSIKMSFKVDQQLSSPEAVGWIQYEFNTAYGKQQFTEINAVYLNPGTLFSPYNYIPFKISIPKDALKKEYALVYDICDHYGYCVKMRYIINTGNDNLWNRFKYFWGKYVYYWKIEYCLNPSEEMNGACSKANTKILVFSLTYGTGIFILLILALVGPRLYNFYRVNYMKKKSQNNRRSKIK